MIPMLLIPNSPILSVILWPLDSVVSKEIYKSNSNPTQSYYENHSIYSNHLSADYARRIKLESRQWQLDWCR